MQTPAGSAPSGRSRRATDDAYPRFSEAAADDERPSPGSGGCRAELNLHGLRTYGRTTEALDRALLPRAPCAVRSGGDGWSRSGSPACPGARARPRPARRQWPAAMSYSTGRAGVAPGKRPPPGTVLAYLSAMAGAEAEVSYVSGAQPAAPRETRPSSSAARAHGPSCPDGQLLHVGDLEAAEAEAALGLRGSLRRWVRAPTLADGGGLSRLASWSPKAGRYARQRRSTVESWRSTRRQTGDLASQICVARYPAALSARGR